jgi:hypothetical protein
LNEKKKEKEKKMDKNPLLFIIRVQRSIQKNTKRLYEREKEKGTKTSSFPHLTVI